MTQIIVLTTLVILSFSCDEEKESRRAITTDAQADEYDRQMEEAKAAKNKTKDENLAPEESTESKDDNASQSSSNSSSTSSGNTQTESQQPVNLEFSWDAPTDSGVTHSIYLVRSGSTPQLLKSDVSGNAYNLMLYDHPELKIGEESCFHIVANADDGQSSDPSDQQCVTIQ